ncbi:MAG: LLM class flavin-dependent oxidoreductase [Salinibacterium sp.]|nr:LLM class flavin-dependent oxidoreductase [Salinibacterium sp.]
MTTNHAALRLALAAPLFAAPGIPTMRTPSLVALSWDTVRSTIMEAERSGYDSVWFSDHLFHGRDGAFHESWTAMSVAAGFTERITLVSNHLGVPLRDARVLAKMATTISDIARGRFELFLGRGYRRREYESYGLPWEDDQTRTRRLSEAIRVIHEMWTGMPVDVNGEFYTTRSAISAPASAKRPFTWVGGPLDDATLELIAASADGWNSFPLSVEEYAHAAERVDAACHAIGRDPATLRRSLETQVLVLDDDDHDDTLWQGWLDHWRQLRTDFPLGVATSDIAPAADALSDAAVTRECRDRFIVGGPSAVASRVAAYSALGVTDLVCWFMDLPDLRSLHRLTDIARMVAS